MITFANELYALQHKGKTGSFSKKEDASHYVKTLLRTCAFSWCLIFDGSASFAAVKDALPETHGMKDKHVAVTSLSNTGAGGVLRLGALSDKESFALLSHYLKDASPQEIAQLSKTLHNHPLAMVQAAAYINATPGMGIPAYIAFFTKSKEDYWASEAKALKGQPLLFKTIKMSIEKLKAASPQDYTMLVALCMLDAHKIERPLIEQAYVTLTNGDMAGFGKITDVALISKVSSDAYAVHDYVRDVVLKTADEDTLKAAASVGAKTMLALFPEKIEDCVAVFEQNTALVGHMKALMAHMDPMPADEAFAAGLRLFYYTYYYERDYDYGKRLSKGLKSLSQKTIHNKPLLVASFLNTNSFMTFREKGLDEAIAESFEAKKILDRLDIETARHEKVMLLANNFASYYYWQGNNIEAEKCINEAEKLSKDQSITPASSSVDFLRFLIKTDRSDFEAASKHLVPLFAFMEKDKVFANLSGHYLNSLKACSLLKMAEMKAYEGDKGAAKDLRMEALQVSLDAYKHALKSADGRDDTDIVARVLLYLSQAQSSLGKAKVAEESARRAIAIFDRELMGTHKNRRQGMASIALGDALTGQGKHADAFAAYLKAEEIFTKISTHLAFDDMSEVWTRLVANAMVRDDSNTMDRCRRLHVAHFADTHPRYMEMVRLITTA